MENPEAHKAFERAAAGLLTSISNTLSAMSEFDNVLSQAMLGLSPEAFADDDAPDEDKEHMLRFYEHHEVYEHCAVIHKSIKQ